MLHFIKNEIKDQKNPRDKVLSGRPTQRLQGFLTLVKVNSIGPHTLGCIIHCSSEV